MPEQPSVPPRRIGLIVLALVVLAVGVGLVVKSWLDSLSPGGSTADNAAPTPASSLLVVTEPPTPTVEPTPAPVVVYISGAVVQPNVYELPHDARVMDVVAAAGGLADDAASERINLAAHIHDAQHIHVPRQSETALPASADSSIPGDAGAATPAGAAATGPLDINTASAAELQTLPGIGEAIAQRIVDYRAQSGPFATVDDLQNVSGIGPALLEQLRPLVRTDGG
jgi:competence protein ComEA